MTSQGSAHGRFTRAIQRRNLFQAELALREMGTPSLLVALDYLELLADVKPEKLESAAVRWHGRLEVEAAAMTLAESHTYPHSRLRHSQGRAASGLGSSTRSSWKAPRH